jgi:hypothetical protein
LALEQGVEAKQQLDYSPPDETAESFRGRENGQFFGGAVARE